MSEIISLSVEPLDIPLKEPFEISLGTQYEASNILVTLTTESGIVGYGEGSPIAPVTGETQGAALDTVQACTSIIEGRSIENYRRIITDIQQAFAGAPSAKFAIETALVDAYCREQNIALAELFGGKPEPVTTDMTIGIMTPEEAVKQANQATSQGFEHLKIKTGNDVDNDIERVVAVAEAAPNASLKVDANQGWTPKETAKFAEQISDRGVSLDLIEQPVPKSDLQGLADTRKRVNIPIAADETVFTPGDAIDVVREQAADIINAKLGKSGLLSVVDISAIATAANLELMIGCMLESAIGIHTSAHLVAGNGRFNYIDLDGNLFHETDVTTIDRGPTHEISGPGHGIIPDFE